MFAASKTASVSGGYQISRSLRFNSADSAYLNRTPATTTNRRTWTWSGWVKLSAFTAARRFFSARIGTTGDQTFIQAAANDTFLIGGNSGDYELRTTAVYRDPSAWYHVVLAFDTTQATASNRIKLYVNGVQVTAFGTATYPTQNIDTFVNTTNPHSLGAESGVPSEFLNGYMTEVNFIDGTQLTPSSFGQTDAQTGVWSPIAYSGSYGTNGFYVNFSDNSNTTAATLGKDYSGNGNNWTPNNFSVTAGAGNDSLVDSPTSYGTDTGVGGTVRGNYCTWNPFNNFQSAVLTNGNLDLSTAGVSVRYGTLTTIGVNSAKWYWEITAGSLSTDGYEIGIASASKSATSPLGSDTESYIYLVNGDKRTNATTVAYGATYTAGDVIGVALDLDAGTLVFYKNGASQGTAYTSIPSNTWFPTVADDATGSTVGSSFIANFGQRPFAYTAPSGYKALCTQNFPTPTIGATTATQAGKYFNLVLYTGTGSSLSVTGVGFQPDFVWVKSRSAATNNVLYDAVRGVQKQVVSNNAGDQTTQTTGLTAFGSDGFTTGALAEMNTSAATYVAWNWKANGAGSSNTSGSITATVSASAASGFSVVTYTGTGVGATVGHGLGVAPQLIFVKGRDTGTADWFVYTSTQAANKFLVLNTTAAAAVDVTAWNNTAPTSTVFSVGGAYSTSWSGKAYVAYCFAPVAGYSAFGYYIGNASTDGTFVYTGFRPRYVMIKVSVASTNNWSILDTSRSPYNVSTQILAANDSLAEYTTADSQIDILSNGFKLRSTTFASGINQSGVTYIYAAFAESPFKYSLAR